MHWAWRFAGAKPPSYANITYAQAIRPISDFYISCRKQARTQMTRCLLTSVALLSLVLVGCSTVGKLHCAPDERPSVNDLLYFGTAKPNGVVSEQDWSVFLRSVVTPHFPSGLTAWPATGQWQSADDSLTRENSFLLNLVHPMDEASEAAIRLIVSEYKSRFQQEAVLRVKSFACASF
jgi:hypothetical protein